MNELEGIWDFLDTWNQFYLFWNELNEGHGFQFALLSYENLTYF